MPLSATYRVSAHDFLAVLAELSPAQLAVAVPACPGWSVSDLLAHQAGSSSDFVGGNLDGVTSRPWTARQVEDRRGRGAAALAAEWRGNVEVVARLCDVIPGPNPAWDVAVHLADLHEAVGLDPLPPEQGWGEVLDAAVAFLGDRAGVSMSVAEEGPDPSSSTWHLATRYGLWRALFSRLEPVRLDREILRGDRRRLCAVAFFGD